MLNPTPGLRVIKKEGKGAPTVMEMWRLQELSTSLPTPSEKSRRTYVQLKQLLRERGLTDSRGDAEAVRVCAGGLILPIQRIT